MDNPHANPCPGWLSDLAWSNACELEGTTDAYDKLRDSLSSNSEQWRAVCISTNPYTQVRELEMILMRLQLTLVDVMP